MALSSPTLPRPLFRPVVRPLFRLLSVIVGLVLAASMLALAGPAKAETPNLPVTVTATPTTNLNDGDVVAIHVDAQSPPNAVASQIFGAEARVCKPDAVIDFSADFNPTQMGNCVSKPLSPGTDSKTTVATAPPNLVADLTFKVGVGTDEYETQGGDPVSITCGPNKPCKLVVKLQVPGAVNFASFPLTYAGSTATAPGAPTAVTGTPGNGTVTVGWTAPASNGGSPITGYTVTAAPGGATCTTTGALSCIVNGLANGTPYTFTVKATNVVGTGPASAPSPAVTPMAPGSKFHPLSPVRILDSRTANGGWNSDLVAGTPRSLQVTGANAVPATADTAVLNVTVTGGTANSFLTVFPTGGSVPATSNLNFAVGQTTPNLVTVKLGTGGKVSFANAVGSTDVIADLVGYYDAVEAGGDKYNAVPPSRILDSRTANGGWNSDLVSGTPRALQVTGRGGVPVGADAVVMNVTATGGTANSFLTAFPTGGGVPVASNVNFAAGETIPNLVTVKLGTGGQVSFNNAVGGTDVIADVVGYFDPTTGDLFHPLNPARILDSRTTNGGWNSDLVAGTPRNLTVIGSGGVPVGATAIIANTTVTGSNSNSFLTVYPSGASLPVASNLNFAVGQTIPNLVAVKVGTGGQVAFATAVGATDVIADVVGYYAAT